MRFDVCIVGLKCYDLLAGAEVPRYLGGIEKVLVCLARGLVGAGQRVAFITYDHGQPDEQVVDGIHVFKAHGPDDGLPVIRFVHPRLTGIWLAMRRADARVYMQMGGGSETGAVAMGCRWLPGRYFVFNLASDADSEADLPLLSLARERWLYRYGLGRADCIVAQTDHQTERLAGEFDRSSVRIALPVAGPGDEFDPPAPPGEGAVRVLWLGRIVEIKRLEWLLAIAECHSDWRFDVVGTANSDSAYANALVERAGALDNVTMHGRVEEEALPGLFGRASALLCTSRLEGFPTTFLEAWSHGIPVVTSFDPDGLVARYDLGCVVDSVDMARQALEGLFASPERWRDYSLRVRRYYLEHYTPEAIVPIYIELFERLGKEVSRQRL